MTKRNPPSKEATNKTTSARVLSTPVLLALFAPAPLASAAYASSGAPFLSGALTAEEVASPSVDTVGKGGFIMKDTIVIRTGGW